MSMIGNYTELHRYNSSGVKEPVEVNLSNALYFQRLRPGDKRGTFIAFENNSIEVEEGYEEVQSRLAYVKQP